MKRLLVSAVLAASFICAPLAHADTGYVPIGDPYTDTIGLWSEIAYALSSLANGFAALFDGHEFAAASPATPSAALAAAAANAESAQAATITYTVQAGDTLSGIAQSYDIPLGNILAANNLSQGAILHPGETLIVPDPQTAPATSSETAPNATSDQATLSQNVKSAEFSSAQSSSPNSTNVIEAGPAFNVSDFVTQSELAQVLLALSTSLSTKSAPTAAPAVPLADGNPLIPYAAENNITNLSGVTITNANLTASEIPDLSSSYLSLNGGAVSGTTTIASALGIGTSTPWQMLSVNGNLALTGALYDDNASSGLWGYVLQSTGSGVNWVATSSLGISGGALSLSGTVGQLAYFSGTNSAVGTSSLFIASSGDIGIGTSSPFTTLSVNGNGYLTGTLTTGAISATNATTTNFSAKDVSISAGTVTFSGSSVSNSQNPLNINENLAGSTTAGNIDANTITINADTASPSSGKAINWLQVVGNFGNKSWQPSLSYAVNTLVDWGGNTYKCTTAGTSAASGGPTGTGASIADGTVIWAYQSSSWAGKRAGLYAAVDARSQSSSATDADKQIQAALFNTTVSANQGGTGTANGSTQGFYYGYAGQMWAESGATDLSAVVGNETDVGIFSGASAGQRTGIQVIGYGDEQGAQTDIGYRLGVNASGLNPATQWAPGFKVGFGLGIGAMDPNGSILSYVPPIAGQLVNSIPEPAPKLAYGIDLNSYLISGAAFRSAGGFLIDGNGALNVGSVKLSATSSAASLDVVGAVITNISLNTSQVGYVVGDQLAGPYGSIITVTAVDGNGRITAFTINEYGGSTQSNPQTTGVTFTGGTGAGVTFNLTWSTAHTLLLNPTSGGDIGIGTTSPSALLSVGGNILGASTLTLAGTTGTTSIASGQGFAIGGSQFVVQQGSGNVGIGTTSPGSIFSVGGVANWTGATTTYYSTGGINLIAGCFSVNGTCVGNGANYWTLSGSDLYNNAATDVGINNSSPNYALDVVGDVNISGGNFYRVAGQGILYASSALFNLDIGYLAGTATTTTGTGDTAIGYSALNHLTSGTGNVVIGNSAGQNISSAADNVYVGTAAGLNHQGAQNIGIGDSVLAANGTGADNVALGHFAGEADAAGADNIFLGWEAASTTGSGSNNIALGYDIDLPSANGSNQLDIGNLIFGTGINGTYTTVSTGNVGIGAPAPYSRLQVTGFDSASSTSALAVVNSASTTVFSVFDGGNAELSGSLSQSSDQRLKTNIQSLDASSSLSFIDELNPVTFNWIDPNQTTALQLGFIAQQVQQIYPNLVSTTSATALTPGGTLSLNYIGLISPIVSAVQALSAEIASIENTIAGFAQRITTQEADVQKLCVGSTCVTPAQFQAMVAAASAAQSSGQGSGGASADDTEATDTPPIIQVNGANPAIIQVGATYNDLGATITGPTADLNLGITTYLNGTEMSPAQIDTSTAATDTVQYVATDQNGFTSTSTRTVIIEAPSIVPPDEAATSTDNATTTAQ